MSSQAELLRQLSIDRGSPSAPAPARWPWLLAALLLLLGGGAYFALRGTGAVPVRAVSVQVKGGAAAASGGSVLDASGYVVARRQATVSSKITGKVMAINFEEGQRVAEGEVLARLDDSNVASQLALAEAQVEQARAQLTELRVSLANAEREARRNRDLLEKKLVSQAVLDNAQTAVEQLRARLASSEQGVKVAQRQLAVIGQQLDDTVVRAPFAGVITVKNAQPGEMISPLSAGGAGTRTGLGTLVDMNSLEVEVDVNENFLNKVRDGQGASTKLNAYPDWEIPSRLVAIIPTADRSKATVKVRVGFERLAGEALDARILPDMGARVSFLAERPAPSAAPLPRRVLMPAEALDGDAVWLLSGSTVSRRVVRTEAAENGYLAVLEGLSGGESLAVGEFGKLSDGNQVKVQGANDE
ncbi:MAG: efflux RND transporter periplasmic adaptor subunit [Stagnimonas sp.]|nr:efflux RND transporter periplasmic adaptor subunit [Stagnimonas sp.]